MLVETKLPYANGPQYNPEYMAADALTAASRGPRVSRDRILEVPHLALSSTEIPVNHLQLGLPFSPVLEFPAEHQSPLPLHPFTAFLAQIRPAHDSSKERRTRGRQDKNQGYGRGPPLQLNQVTQAYLSATILPAGQGDSSHSSACYQQSKELCSGKPNP